MPSKQDDLLQKVLSDFGADHEEHQKLVEEYDKRYRAYRAVIEKRSKANEWTNKQHPAYVFQSVETMVANLVDPNPKWRLRVLPQMASPERLEELRQGARANELLLSHQLTLDHWAEKQRPFDLQGLICGVTASKQSWCYRTGEKRSQRFGSRPLIDAFGFSFGSVPTREDVVEKSVFRDDPTSEVVDVRHLIFQRGAVSLPMSERITHRVYHTKEHLKRYECQVNGGKPHEGECTPGRYYHDIDKLDDSPSGDPNRFTRESELFGTQPHRGEHMILEQWRREGDKLRCVSVADEKVVIGNRLSPFWFDHLEHPFPFAVCSGSPDLFRIQGISEVEVMAELQEMLWTLLNARLDVVQFAANAIALIADDVEDPDSFEWAPGERWLVPRPVEETVKMWHPDLAAAQVTLESEALLKGDLQNVTGGMPFLSGTDTANVDQQTATGVSIVTSLAQKRLAAKRQQFIWAKSRIGEQWSALNQQYVRAPRAVPVIGEDGVEAFEEVRPELLQGDFVFECEISEESLNRQEKRAEAQSKYQIAAGSAAVMAAAGAPLNMRAFMDDVLEAYDITDTDRYYSQVPQLPPGQAPPPPGMNGGSGGITNTALAAGMSSPSNDASMNPASAMQQLMAMQGGEDNA